MPSCRAARTSLVDFLQVIVIRNRLRLLEGAVLEEISLLSADLAGFLIWWHLCLSIIRSWSCSLSAFIPRNHGCVTFMFPNETCHVTVVLLGPPQLAWMCLYRWPLVQFGLAWPFSRRRMFSASSSSIIFCFSVCHSFICCSFSCFTLSRFNCSVNSWIALVALFALAVSLGEEVVSAFLALLAFFNVSSRIAFFVGHLEILRLLFAHLFFPVQGRPTRSGNVRRRSSYSTANRLWDMPVP